MFRKIKSLSFNARLVIAMNAVMAVIMVLFAAFFSYEIIGQLRADLDAKVQLEADLLAEGFLLYSDDVALIQSKGKALVEKFSKIGKVEVFKAGQQLLEEGSVDKKEDLGLAKHVAGDIEVKVHYSYAQIWPQLKSEFFVLYTMLFFGMIVFSSLLYFISRKLIKPLFEVVDVISESTTLTTNHAIKLKEMSGSVQTSGDIINQGSESTTSSMEQLTAMIENSVQELNKCMEFADSVNSKADQGTGVMNRLVGSMEVIEEANKRLNELGTIFEEISSKTSVINDIVFKTQLLSFNASIEAARAGQHGRGFSVVAEEIGNLAQMSGKSATEISTLLSSSENHVKTIISGTDEKIAEGRAVSLEALQSFDDIRRDIGEITESIQGVTGSTHDQEDAVKATLNTMINMKETVNEQGIYTRSIGKSAAAISDQSDKLESAELYAKKLVYGTFTNHDGKDELNKDSKKFVMHLVNKMGKSKMEVADEDVA